MSRAPSNVIEHGSLAAPTEWRVGDVPRPRGLRLRTPKACFLNASRIVLDDRYRDWRYVEGWAWGRAGTDSPVHHAWCVDEHGLVVEPTWRDHGARYYGSVVPALIVARALVSGEQSVFREHFVNGALVLRPRSDLDWSLEP